MAEKSKIEWCDATFNPWIGCTKISPGCDRCYAEALMDTRYGKVKWGPHGERVRTSEANWRLPLRWAKQARRQQELFEEGMLTVKPHRPRVFCASLADVFDNQVPAEWRTDLFRLIHATPELDWLLLTKRPENVEKMMIAAITGIGSERNPPNINPSDLLLPSNIWLGFTAEDQERFDRRWPIVRDIPAAVRFCSYEPAIGPLRIALGRPDASRVDGDVAGLHWLICGGESGRGHREMDPRWEEDIRRDCEAAGIAYFLKQFAGKRPFPAGFHVLRQFPGAAA